MAITYRVVDLREKTIDPTERLIEGAQSPEDALRQALGIEATRNGARENLAARVYWRIPGQPMNMVRMYKSGQIEVVTSNINAEGEKIPGLPQLSTPAALLAFPAELAALLSRARDRRSALQGALAAAPGSAVLSANPDVATNFSQAFKAN